MPVPSSITELSKVASENSPAGTESPRGVLDDYFRAHASFIRQLFDLIGGATVTLPAAPTVNIGFASSANIVITGTATISAFDVAPEGTLRYVIFIGAMTLKNHPSSFQMPGGADILTVPGDSGLFKSLGGGNWACMAYWRKSGTGPVAASMTTDGYLSVGDWNSFNSRLTPAGAAATYMPRAGGDFGGTISAPGLVAVASGGPGEGGRLYLNRAADNAPSIFWQAFGTDAKPSVRMVTPDGQVVTITSIGDITSRSHTSTSDERLKKKWRRRPADFLQRVAGLRKLGSFLWKKDGTPGIGGSAQEFEEIWPEAVHTDERGFKSLNYGAAAFVIAVELARAFVAHVAKNEKRLAKLEGK